MSFKTCRKCSYRFIPLEFYQCPKCMGPVPGPWEAKRVAFWVGCAVIGSLAICGAIVLLPRISITIQ